MTRLDAILIGDLAPLGPRAEPSGIRKHAVAGRLVIGTLGVVGDHQGDLRVHGGPDKAIHHYAFDHYAAWRREIGAIEALDAPGGFGENLSTTGLVEADIAIGDVFRVGTATVQVSQARNPCWKLNARFGVRDLAIRVIASGRAGWYYRVLEGGSAEAGDALIRIDRAAPHWPLPRAWVAMHGDTASRDELAELAALPVLAEAWRQMAGKRLAKLGQR